MRFNFRVGITTIVDKEAGPELMGVTNLIIHQSGGEMVLCGHKGAALPVTSDTPASLEAARSGTLFGRRGETEKTTET